MECAKNAPKIPSRFLSAGVRAALRGRLVVDDDLGLKYFATGARPGRDIGGLFEFPPEKMASLEWIARLTSHIRDAGCQMTHYYGAYSNAHRGKQERGGSPGNAQTGAAEPEDEWIRARRRSWARPIQQVYECHPLLCECGAKLTVVSVIEARSQTDLVGKISQAYQVSVRRPRDPGPAAGACYAE